MGNLIARFFRRRPRQPSPSSHQEEGTALDEDQHSQQNTGSTPREVQSDEVGSTKLVSATTDGDPPLLGDQHSQNNIGPSPSEFPSDEPANPNSISAPADGDQPLPDDQHPQNNTGPSPSELQSDEPANPNPIFAPADVDQPLPDDQHPQSNTGPSPSEFQSDELAKPNPSSKLIDRDKPLPGSKCIAASKATGSKSIYKPPMKSAFAEGRKDVATYEVGTASPDEGESTSYVVLLVGATGAGKSTLINGIANYVLGVRWEDSYRYKVIAEEPDVDQAHSQTQRVASYTLHAVHPSRFRVTVIDTPGFGEVEETNKRILPELKQFLSVSGIDSINAVGFVTEASSARLTPTQKYIFHSISNIFGKDIASSILLMATFADAKTPPVVGALQEAGATFRKCFRFNNSALYPEEDDKDNDSLDSEDAEQANFDEMFWDWSMNSFTDFFEELVKMNDVLFIK